MYRFFWMLLGACICVEPLAAQQNLKNIPDPDPELERRALQVADGFEVHLYAADPMLAKPIQMNFDAAGRLWVACSEVYPQIKPGQKANDKILILEDTDGDGRADKTTVFADGLLIPTGLEPGDGGCYVANSTELLHLTASPNQTKADRVRVVLSGFGTEDTHHILHTLRWGPDGMLYFNQSIYIHSHIETPRGVRRLNAGGVWQFRPETMELEVFTRGLINPWGHHFDRWGQSFQTDGAGGEGIHYTIPGAYYATAANAGRILPGLNPGSPKYCGLEVVSGRHLPPDWQGNLLTNDFRGHRVCRFVLKEDGAGYAAIQQADLIKTNHAAFRPVDIKMGPDGAIYIADWYNPIIQHGEVDFRDPRRDQVRGRIWRVTAKNRPLVPRPHLVQAKTTELLDQLKSPEDWTRHFAKRVLKERGRAQVLRPLADWIASLDKNDPNHEHQLLEALWLYQSLHQPNSALLEQLLRARDHRVRAAAVRVLSYWHPHLTNALELLSERVADEHPQVRLEAVRALGVLPDPRAIEIALRALDRPVDRFLDYGLWLTARETQTRWLPAFRAGTLTFGGNARHLLFALQATGSKDVVAPLVELIQSKKVAPEREEEVLLLLASLGGPNELELVFRKATATHSQLLLSALESAARQRFSKPAGDLTTLQPLLAERAGPIYPEAIRLVGAWKVEPLRKDLLRWLAKADTPPPILRAATQALAELGTPADRDTLLRLAKAPHRLPVRRAAVMALTLLVPETAAHLVVEQLTSTTADEELGEVVLALLDRKNGATLLLQALADKPLPADAAKIAVRAVRNAGREFPQLVDRLTQAGKLTSPKRTLTAAEVEQFVQEVRTTGNAARGEAIYRRKELACMNCHALGGAGGQVGPELASIGASAPIDYLIESLLEPHKKVKENYHALIVTTTEGKIFTGIKVRETKTELVLRTAEDKEIILPTSRIEEKENGKSLMPEGLVDPLTRAELVDLVRFLSELGQVGPYSIGKERVVRRWQVLLPTEDNQKRLRRDGLQAVTSNDPALAWGSAYSRVNGELPLQDAKFDQWTVLRCELDVSVAGAIVLKLNRSEGVQLWLDGKAVPIEGPTIPLTLPTGRKTLTFVIDASRRTAGLRCEIEEAPLSPARVAVVGGK